MRVFFPLLLAALIAGCQFEPRTDAPVQPDNAQLVDAADVPEIAAPDRVRQPTEDPARAATSGKPEVVLYVTEWCPYCAQAREYMTAENVPYRVVDIESSQQAQAEYQRMGGTGGIPLVAVGAETIEGWSAQAARQMLDAAGYD